MLPDEASEAVEKIVEKVFAGEMNLFVPGLWAWECVNLLKSAFRRSRICEQDVRCALRALSELPVELIPLQASEYSLLFETARRYELSSYDAAYFYLAEKTGVTLITLDDDLLRLRKDYPFILSPDQAI